MLGNVREEHPQMVKQAMEGVGSEWMQELGRIISVDIEVDAARDFGLLGLRNHVFSVSLDESALETCKLTMAGIFAS
jgi:hypothetical protein